jgi:hypothetical protein
MNQPRPSQMLDLHENSGYCLVGRVREVNLRATTACIRLARVQALCNHRAYRQNDNDPISLGNHKYGFCVRVRADVDGDWGQRPSLVMNKGGETPAAATRSNASRSSNAHEGTHWSNGAPRRFRFSWEIFFTRTSAKGHR